TGIAPQADPLAALRVPDQPAMHFQAEKLSGDLYPGTYENGIHVSGQAAVILHPGVYYLKGSLEVSGEANVRGDGVTLYVSRAAGRTDSESPGRRSSPCRPRPAESTRASRSFRPGPSPPRSRSRATAS